MAETTHLSAPSIKWYRSPVPKDEMRKLQQRSDLLGFLQAGGHVALTVLTGTAACLAAGRLAWPWVVLLVYLHGTVCAFLLNGFHELVHRTVFKTDAFNKFFLYLFSFIGWHSPALFWQSHMAHHKYTLYPPSDQEVVLPQKLTLKDYLKSAIVNPWGVIFHVKMNWRFARGRLQGDWENALFPESAVDARRDLFRWARILLFGHATIIVVSLAAGWWMIPVVVSLVAFYGNGLMLACNHTQHIGLQDKVPDFRLSCRTVILNPVLRFLYWHMNYHIEHHMYAAVPCYRLGRLHELIKDDLPVCHKGLAPAWREIVGILKKQKADPEYQHVAALPERPQEAPV